MQTDKSARMLSASFKVFHAIKNSIYDYCSYLFTFKHKMENSYHSIELLMRFFVPSSIVMGDVLTLEIHN